MKTIYYNGDFITLENNISKEEMKLKNLENADENLNYVDSILVENGIIRQVGKQKEILKNADSETKLIDLEGMTMMPSFIDAHSHFSAVVNEFLQASLKQTSSVKEIQDKLVKYKLNNNINDGEWIIANGYDHNNLEENRHITKSEIDEVLPNNPVVITHQSGHSGIFNSEALKQLGINENTIAPEGGKIEKINGKLTGYLEENAYIQYIKKPPMPDIMQIREAVRKAEKKYASYGITTVQEGFFPKELIYIYQDIVNNKLVDIDLVGYADKNIYEDIKQQFYKNIKEYYNNLKINGIKIFLDGSPQSRTAWMREPYIDDDKYYGYGTMKDEEVEEAVKFALTENIQILAHCNGDRACQQYIDTISKFGENAKKIRPVLIHGQFLAEDQIEETKRLGIIPSFFVAHTYYWGDVHIKNFGIDRANKISPLASSLKNDLLFTLHQDSPVIESNMLETIWCATTRETKSGKILGQEERIGVLDAIKAVTINAAYQYFEENLKGSIKEGKIADLVILDKNPLNVEKDEIKDIKIVETIKSGKTIFKL